MQPTFCALLVANKVILTNSRESRFVHSAEKHFVFLMFKLDCSLSNGDEKRGDRIDFSLSLDAAWTWRAGLINILTPIHSHRDSHLSNVESCPSNYIHWRQPVLAFFQTVVTSDSVGAGVIAQHEHRTLLSRFRHCSVTSMRSEIRRGNSWAGGSANERCVWSKAAPAVPLQHWHIQVC